MSQLLDTEAVREKLSSLDGWNVSPDGRAIEKSWEFSDFAHALAFVNAVGACAEREDHHPDIEFGWGRAKISLATHSAGGITDKDINLAAKIDAIER